MQPTVKLVSWTKDPIETLYHLWLASRSDGDVPSVADLLDDGRSVERSMLEEHAVQARRADMMKTFEQILDAGIPVAENVSFVFVIDNVSIALREQMVRHRIGVKVGDRVGMDHAPDLADSTWWSQSMRILEMSEFAQRGHYLEPEMTDEQQGVYDEAMQHAEQAYVRLVESGMPMEDARNVIPLAATHRISWTLNLAALKHIIGKRGCWILQLGIWEPIIKGMVEELATKIHPIFRKLIAPPCVKGDCFKGCHFNIDNERRLEGEDKIPPCSLWLAQERKLSETSARAWVAKHHDLGLFDAMRASYGKLWGRSTETGATV